MELKILLSAFWIIFLAELGDKTQLAAVSMSASTKKPLEVFLAASAALVVASGMGVLFGSILSKFISPDVLRASGVFFLFL